MNSQPRTLDKRALSAIRARNNDVDRIMADSELRNRIQRLFEEGKSNPEIIQTIGKNMLVPSNCVSYACLERLLRDLFKELYDVVERREHAFKVHSKTASENENSIAEGRRQWMEEQGFFVWTEEEHEYFMFLITHPEMKRSGKSGRLNHTKIADAMNDRFGVDYFTPKRCQDHYYNSNKAVWAERRRRKREGKQNGEV